MCFSILSGGTKSQITLSFKGLSVSTKPFSDRTCIGSSSCLFSTSMMLKRARLSLRNALDSFSKCNKLSVETDSEVFRAGAARRCQRGGRTARTARRCRPLHQRSQRFPKARMPKCHIKKHADIALIVHVYPIALIKSS